MNKKNIFLWTLYDFANSIVMIVFFLYFSQWLVVEKGVPDLWYNMIFAAGSLLLLFTAPVLGSVADKNGKQQNYFNIITLLSFFTFILVSLIALFFSGNVFLAIFLFLLANYLYQFSFVFYNALLPFIAPREKWGRISGIGQTGNWLGQIFGVLVALPFVSGAFYLFGIAGRTQALLPATILFIILALPMLLFFKLPKQKIAHEKVNFKEEYKHYWQNFKELVGAPGMGMFLLSYLLFNDAIITAANNFPIYLEKVFAVSDKVKSILLLCILITSAIGAFGAGFVADKFGLRRTLLVILSSWAVIFPALAFTSNFNLFTVFTILMGFMYGATWTVTRATMTAICPKEKLNFGFSFYTLAERVATLFGPLAYGLTLFLFSHLGPTSYKIAIMVMTIFVILGIFFLKKVKIPENKEGLA